MTAMIYLTVYIVSNVGVEVDDDSRYDQEHDGDIAVEPEHRVGLIKLRLVEKPKTSSDYHYPCLVSLLKEVIIFYGIQHGDSVLVISNVECYTVTLSKYQVLLSRIT